MHRSSAARAVPVEDPAGGVNRVGVVYCDSGGLILECNSRARRLLEAGLGVQERGGRLSAERPQDAEALELLLDGATDGVGPGSATFGTSEGRRVVVHVKPIVNGSVAGRGAAGPRVAACVLLVDPWSELSVSAETLMDRLGLTAAQAQVVAGLVRGMTVREIAAATRRKPGSVRWHVKRALERTGARRQSDLVRAAIMATFVPVL